MPLGTYVREAREKERKNKLNSSNSSKGKTFVENCVFSLCAKEKFFSEMCIFFSENHKETFERVKIDPQKFFSKFIYSKK